MTSVKFGKGNGKFDHHTFSLPAGWACPGAKDCLARADRDTGKVTDGPGIEFRCFAASMERYASVRGLRWRNLDALKAAATRKVMGDMLLAALPTDATIVRVHVSGDFFNQAYFLAWCDVARARPDVLFYAYTKSLDVWARNAASVPANLVLTASLGGRHDDLAERHGLRTARVVLSEGEADALGLEIDHDDSHAMRADGKDFALLIHGTQPPGSEAAKAWQRVKADQGGYGEKSKRRTALAMA